MNPSPKSVTAAAVAVGGPGPVVVTHSTWSVEQLMAVLRRRGFDIDEATPHRRDVVDTADARLFGAGVRLDVDAKMMRLHDGTGSAARCAVPGRFREASDLPAGPLRTRLQTLTNGRALLPVASYTFSERRVRHVDTLAKAVVGGAVVEDAHVDGVRVEQPWLLQLDPVTGFGRAFDTIVAALLAAGCVRHRGDAVAVAAAMRGVDLHPPALVLGRRLRRRTPAASAIRTVLNDLWAAVEANWEGTIAEVDVEFLHDLRVAVRRTRSVLGTAGAVIPADTLQHFRGEFRWLGAVTGRPRDLDVYLEEWPGYIATLDESAATHLQPVLDHLAQHRLAAHATLVKAMESPRADRLRADWAAWLAGDWSPPPGDGESAPPGDGERDGAVPAGDQPIGPLVAAWIRNAHRRVIRHGRRIDDDSPAESLHDLRKRAKRLRYLIECFAGALPTKGRKAFVSELKELQDNLGEHQDAAVHIDELHPIAAELDERRLAVASRRTAASASGGVPTESLVALGQLSERLQWGLSAARSEFSERFDAFDSKRVRTSLDTLLAKLER